MPAFVVIPLAALAAAGAPSTAAAQENARWSLDLGAGAAFATDELVDADLGTGFGFDGTLGLRFAPHLWIYGGWGWRRFTSEDFVGVEADVEETGYAYGVRFEHPFTGEGDGPAFRLQAGGTYSHIELEDEGGTITVDSGHGVGWEAGAAVVLPLGASWRLVPGARYRSLSRELEVAGFETDVDLTYVTLEAAVSWVF